MREYSGALNWIDAKNKTKCFINRQKASCQWKLFTLFHEIVSYLYTNIFSFKKRRGGKQPPLFRSQSGCDANVRFSVHIFEYRKRSANTTCSTGRDNGDIDDSDLVSRQNGFTHTHVYRSCIMCDSDVIFCAVTRFC